MPRKSQIILGLSYGHGDSSAALVVNGRLVAAAEEERFTRVKHYGLFPFHAIQYCLRHAKISPKQVQCVAIAKKPLNQLSYRISLALRFPQLVNRPHHKDESNPGTLRGNLRKAQLSHATVTRVEHHLAHLMSARYLTNSDHVSLMSFDGLGDFASVAMGVPKENSIDILHRVLFPHSVGFFYSAMTQYLGFPHFGDEFKVMGLSSYGKPKYLEGMRDLIRDNGDFGFKLNLEAFPLLRKSIGFRLENAQPKIDTLYQPNYVTQVLGISPRKANEKLSTRHEDVAASIQARFEEVATRLLLDLYHRTDCRTLALAGGCAHNSVWVGKIPSLTLFNRVLVAPASHDGGISVGAAIEAAGRPVTPEDGDWMLLGPSHLDSPVTGIPPELESQEFSDDDKLVRHLANELSEGKIVGLFHGRMEFGPRALGSRSIIADPRGTTMKDKLNARVKHREAFRPFAASVLNEHQDDWFENSFFAPTMEAVFPVKPSVQAKIPAVTHVDGTCRIQSVTREFQPFYWKLIDAFRKKTGVPMLLNTSFNDSEPIVCTEEDAIHCFLNCEMDILVLGNRVFTRKNAALSLTA